MKTSVLLAFSLASTSIFVDARPRGERKSNVHVSRKLGHNDPWCGDIGMMETCPPTRSPSAAPSESPTISQMPSASPSAEPSAAPTISSEPTISAQPSSLPSATPSAAPSALPSASPSGAPTISSAPSALPSVMPSRLPSASPSAQPTREPSSSPSVSPSDMPSSTPTISSAPTIDPFAFDTVIVEGESMVSTCRPDVPDGARSQRQTIGFNYTMITTINANLTTMNVLVASTLQLNVAEAMLDCNFGAQRPFYQHSTTTEFADFEVSTSPCPEDIEYNTTVEACSVLDATTSSLVFYQDNNRRRLQDDPPSKGNITDREVGIAYNDTLTAVFGQDLLPNVTAVVDLKYGGLTNFFPAPEPPQDDGDDTNVGAIVGSVLAGLALFALLLLFFMKRRKREKYGEELKEEDEAVLMDDVETMSAAERTKTLFVHDEEESTVQGPLPIVAGEDESTIAPQPMFVPVSDTPNDEELRQMTEDIQRDLGPSTSYDANSSGYKSDPNDTVDL